MEEKNIIQNLSNLVEKILGSGITVNGQIGVTGLTITSVDKVKELGIVKESSQQQESQSEKPSQQKGQDEGGATKIWGTNSPRRVR